MSYLPLVLVSVLATLSLTGCGEDKCDSGEDCDSAGDTNTECGDPLATELNTINITRDGAGGANSLGYWQYDVETIGWAGAISVDIYQSAGGIWEEYHEFTDNTDSDACGQWDKWSLYLDIVGTMDDQISGATTLNDADNYDNMTWMFTAYDMDGNAADCAVGGLEPEWYSAYGCWSF